MRVRRGVGWRGLSRQWLRRIRYDQQLLLLLLHLLPLLVPLLWLVVDYTLQLLEVIDQVVEAVEVEDDEDDVHHPVDEDGRPEVRHALGVLDEKEAVEAHLADHQDAGGHHPAGETADVLDAEEDGEEEVHEDEDGQEGRDNREHCQESLSGYTSTYYAAKNRLLNTCEWFSQIHRVHGGEGLVGFALLWSLVQTLLLHQVALVTPAMGKK